VCGKGSTGRIITDMYHHLQSHGHSCRIAYGRGSHPDDINAYRIGTNKDVYVHALCSRLSDKAGFYSTLATFKLIEDIQAFEPDIIHLHNLHGYYLNVRILFDFLKSYNKPVVWTLHDCWAFTGHCVHFAFAQCDKWKTGCYDCKEKHRYPSSWLLDRSRQNYNQKKETFLGLRKMTIITVSDWLKDMVKQSFLNVYPARRIYNGIDSDVFHHTQSEIKHRMGIDKKWLVLSVSDGWDERKGFDDILKVAKLAPKNWAFVIVGLKPKQIKQLPSNVIGMERTWNVQELVELYSAADVFLNLSKEETFGLVTVEALACGSPAVVYNSTASPELVDDSCGVVIPMGDIEGVVTALKKMENSQRYKEENCCARSQLFSVNKTMAEILALYEELYLGEGL
jgi:putative colanic acid biosynthesis glycosyltransferase